MKKVKVILDCDDVLFECNTEAIRRINEATGNFRTIMDLVTWGIGDEDPEIGYEKRKVFFEDPEFVLNQPCAEGAVDFVKRLSKVADVYICTAVPPQCVVARMMAIRSNFPFIDPSNVIFGKRKDLLAGDFMLDDAVHNLASQNIHYPVLYRRPWNFSTTGMVSVSTFDEFLTLVNMVQQPVMDIKRGSKVTAIVGPSGSGKTYVSRILCESEAFVPVKSWTTRKKRSENEDTYHFVDDKTFHQMKEDGMFFETSVYQGCFYGTTKDSIYEALKKDVSPVLVLDINGAIAIKKEFGERALSIYLKRDKKACITSILNRRLSIEETARRICSIDAEMRMEELCDISVQNNVPGKFIVESIMKKGAF